MDRNVLFQGSIPENYDHYLGPVIFEPFAQDLAARLQKATFDSVLEVACGTGIVTRCLRDALPATTEIVATDLNANMYQFAQRKFKKDEPVRWLQADASALPFPDASFDAVVCQFGLMFVPDKLAAAREAYRVLRNRGTFLFNVWDSMEANPFGQIAHETIASFFDHDPPRFYQIPFSLSDAESIREILREAGFTKIELFIETRPLRSKSAKEFATGLVLGNPTGPELVERGVNTDKVIAALAERLAESFGKAPVQSTMRALVWEAAKN